MIPWTAIHFRRFGVYLALCGMREESSVMRGFILSHRVDDMPFKKNWEGDKSFVKFYASHMAKLTSLAVFPCPLN